MDDDFDQFGISASYSFVVEKNAISNMKAVRGEIRALEEDFERLVKAFETGNFGQVLASDAATGERSLRAVNRTVQQGTNNIKATRKALAPLKQDFRALKAAAQNVNFGNLDNAEDFARGSRALRIYIRDIEELRQQVQGTTSIEKEFNEVLKRQQGIAQGRIDLARAERRAAKASQNLGSAQALQGAGRAVLSGIAQPVESAQELQQSLGTVQKLADNISKKGLVDIRNDVLNLAADLAIADTQVSKAFEDLAGAGKDFSDAIDPQTGRRAIESRMAEVEQILKNKSALDITTDAATELDITLGSIYKNSLPNYAGGIVEVNARAASSINELTDRLSDVKISATDVVPVMRVVMNTIGDASNFPVDQIAAFSAAVSSLGTIEPEAAGSFFNRFSAAVSKNPSAYVEKLGYASMEAFDQAINTDKLDVIVRIAEQYKSINGELERGKFLGKGGLGLGSAQDQKLIQGLANNIKVLHEARDVARAGFYGEVGEDLSVQKEFNRVSQTSAFQAERFNKALKALQDTLGLAVQDAITPVLNALSNTISLILKLSQTFPDVTKVVSLATLAFGGLAATAGTLGVTLFSLEKAGAVASVALLSMERSMLPLTGFFDTAQLALAGTNPLETFFRNNTKLAGDFSRAVTANFAETTSGLQALAGQAAGTARAFWLLSRAIIFSPIGLTVGGFILLNTLLEQVVPGFNLLGVVLGAIAAPFGFVYGLLKGLTESILEFLGLTGSGAFNAITPIFQTIGNAIELAAKSFTLFASSGERLGQQLGHVILLPFELAGRGIVTAWEVTIGTLRNILSPFASFVQRIGELLVSFLAENSPGPTYQIREKWAYTIGFLQNIFGNLVGVAKSVGTAIASGFQQALPHLVRLGSSMAIVSSLLLRLQGLINPVQSILAIGAASVAEFFTHSYDSIESLLPVIGGLTNKILGLTAVTLWFSNAVAPLQALGLLIAGELLDGLISNLPAVQSAMSNFWGKTVIVTTSAVKTIKGTVVRLWEGMIGGIQRMLSAFVGLARNIGQQLVSALAENSPGPTFQIREKWQQTSQVLVGLFHHLVDAAQLVNTAFLNIGGDASADERLLARQQILKNTVNVIISTVKSLTLIGKAFVAFQNMERSLIEGAIANFDFLSFTLLTLSSLPATLLGQLEVGFEQILPELELIATAGIPRAILYALPGSVALAMSTGAIKGFERGFSNALDALPGTIKQFADKFYALLTPELITQINQAVSSGLTEFGRSMPDTFGADFQFNFNLDATRQGLNDFIDGPLTAFIGYLHKVGDAAQDVGRNIIAIIEPFLRFKLGDIFPFLSIFPPLLPILTAVIPAEKALVNLSKSPSLIGLMKFLSGSVLPAALKTLVSIGAVITYISGAIILYPIAMLQVATQNITKATAGLVTQLRELIPLLPTIAKELIKAFGRAVANAILSTAGAVAGLLEQIPGVGRFLAGAFLRTVQLIVTAFPQYVSLMISELRPLWAALKSTAAAYGQVFRELLQGVGYFIDKGLKPLGPILSKVLDPRAAFNLLSLYLRTKGFRGIIKPGILGLSPFDLLFSPITPKSISSYSAEELSKLPPAMIKALEAQAKRQNILKPFLKPIESVRRTLVDALKLGFRETIDTAFPLNVVKSKQAEVLKVLASGRSLKIAERYGLPLADLIDTPLANLYKGLMLLSPYTQILGRLAMTTLFWYSILKPLDREMLTAIAHTEVLGHNLTIVAVGLRIARFAVVDMTDALFFMARALPGVLRTTLAIFDKLGTTVGIVVHEIVGVSSILGNIIKATIINPLTLIPLAAVGALEGVLIALRETLKMIKAETQKYGDAIIAALHGDFKLLGKALVEDLILTPTRLLVMAFNATIGRAFTILLAGIKATVAEIGRIIRDPIGEAVRLAHILSDQVGKALAQLNVYIKQLQLDRLADFIRRNWMELTPLVATVLRLLGIISNLQFGIGALVGAIAFLMHEYQTGFQTINSIIEGLQHPIDALNGAIQGILGFLNVYISPQMTEVIANVAAEFVRLLPVITGGIFLVALVIKRNIGDAIDLVIGGFVRVVGQIQRAVFMVGDLKEGIVDAATSAQSRVFFGEKIHNLRSQSRLGGIANPFAYSKDAKQQQRGAYFGQQEVAKGKAALDYQKNMENSLKNVQEGVLKEWIKMAKKGTGAQKAEVLGGEVPQVDEKGQIRGSYKATPLLEKKANRYGIERLVPTDFGKDVLEVMAKEKINFSREKEFTDLRRANAERSGTAPGWWKFVPGLKNLKAKSEERPSLASAFRTYGTKTPSENFDKVLSRLANGRELEVKRMLNEFTESLKTAHISEQQVDTLYVKKMLGDTEIPKSAPADWRVFDEQLKIFKAKTTGLTTRQKGLVEKIPGLAELEAAIKKNQVTQSTNKSAFESATKSTFNLSDFDLPTTALGEIPKYVKQLKDNLGDVTAFNKALDEILNDIAIHQTKRIAEDAQHGIREFAELEELNKRFLVAGSNASKYQISTGVNVLFDGFRNLAEDAKTASHLIEARAEATRTSFGELLFGFTGIPQLIETIKYNRKAYERMRQYSGRTKKLVERDQADYQAALAERQRGLAAVVSNLGGLYNKDFASQEMDDFFKERGISKNLQGLLKNVVEGKPGKRFERTASAGETANIIKAVREIGTDFSDTTVRVDNGLTEGVNMLHESVKNFNNAEKELFKRFLEEGTKGWSTEDQAKIRTLAENNKSTLRQYQNFQQQLARDNMIPIMTEVLKRGKLIVKSDDERRELAEALGISVGRLRQIQREVHRNPLKQLRVTFDVYVENLTDQAKKINDGIEAGIEGLERNLARAVSRPVAEVIIKPIRWLYTSTRDQFIKGLEASAPILTGVAREIGDIFSFPELNKQFRKIRQQMTDAKKSSLPEILASAKIPNDKGKQTWGKDNKRKSLWGKEALPQFQTRLLDYLKKEPDFDQTKAMQAVSTFLKEAKGVSIRDQLKAQGLDDKTIESALAKALGLAEEKVKKIINDPNYTTKMAMPYQVYLLKSMPGIVVASVKDLGRAITKTVGGIAWGPVRAVVTDVFNAFGADAARALSKLSSDWGDRLKVSIFNLSQETRKVFGDNILGNLLNRFSRVVGDFGKSASQHFKTQEALLNAGQHSYTRIIFDGAMRLYEVVASGLRAVGARLANPSSIFTALRGFFKGVKQFFGNMFSGRELKEVKESIGRTKERIRQNQEHLKGARKLPEGFDPFSRSMKVTGIAQAKVGINKNVVQLKELNRRYDELTRFSPTRIFEKTTKWIGKSFERMSSSLKNTADRIEKERVQVVTKSRLDQIVFDAPDFFAVQKRIFDTFSEVQPLTSKILTSLVRSAQSSARGVGNYFSGAAQRARNAWINAENALTGKNWPKLVKFAYKVGKSLVGALNHGAADRTAQAWERTQQSTTQNMQQMAQAAQTTGKEIAGEMQASAQKSAGFFSKLGGSIGSVGKAGIAIGGAVTAVGFGAQTAMYSLSTMGLVSEETSERLNKFFEIFTIFGAIGGIATPILAALASSMGAVGAVGGTAATGVMALGGALAGLVGLEGAALAPLILGIGAITAAVAGLYFAFKSNFLGLTTLAKGFGTLLGQLFAAPIGFVQRAWQGFIDNFGSKLLPIVQPAIDIGNMLINALNHNPTEKIPLAWEVMQQRIGGVFNWLLETGVSIGGKIAGIFSPLTNLFKHQDSSTVKSSVVGDSSSKEAIKTPLTVDVNSQKKEEPPKQGFFGGMMERLGGVLGGVANLVRPLAEPVKQIAGFFESLASIAESVKKINEALSPLVGKTKQVIDSVQQVAYFLYNIASIIESAEFLYKHILRRDLLKGEGEDKRHFKPKPDQKGEPLGGDLGEVVDVGVNALTLGTSVPKVWKAWSDFFGWFSKLSFVQQALEWGQGLISALNCWPTVVIGKAWEGLSLGIILVLTGVVAAAVGIGFLLFKFLSDPVGNITRAWEGLKSLFSTIFADIKIGIDLITAGITGFIGFVMGIPGTVQSAFSGVKNFLGLGDKKPEAPIFTPAEVTRYANQEALAKTAVVDDFDQLVVDYVYPDMAQKETNESIIKSMAVLKQQNLKILDVIYDQKTDTGALVLGSQNKDEPIKVVFRYATSDALSKDVLKTGIGDEAMAGNRDQIEEALKRYSVDGRDIELMGWSLGSAIAQRTAAEFPQYIKSVSGFNPVGIDKETVAAYRKAAAPDARPDVKYFVNANDAASTTGQEYLPGDVYKFRKKQGLGDYFKELQTSIPGDFHFDYMFLKGEQGGTTPPTKNEDPKQDYGISKMSSKQLSSPFYTTNAIESRFWMEPLRENLVPGAEKLAENTIDSIKNIKNAKSSVTGMIDEITHSIASIPEKIVQVWIDAITAIQQAWTGFVGGFQWLMQPLVTGAQGIGQTLVGFLNHGAADVTQAAWQNTATNIIDNLGTLPPVAKDIGKELVSNLDTSQVAGNEKTIFDEALKAIKATNLLPEPLEKALDYSLIKSGTTTQEELGSINTQAKAISDPVTLLKDELVELRIEMTKFRIALMGIDLVGKPIKIYKDYQDITAKKATETAEVAATAAAAKPVATSLSQRLGGAKPQQQVQTFTFSEKLIIQLKDVVKSMQVTAAAMNANAVAMMAALANNPIFLISAAITGVIALAEILTPKLDVVATIVGGLVAPFGFIKGAVQAIIDLTGFQPKVQKFFESLNQPFSFQPLIDFANSTKATISSIFGGSTDLGREFIHKLVAIISSTLADLSDLSNILPDLIENAFTKIKTLAINAANAISTQPVQIIQQAWSGAIKWIGNLFSGWIDFAAKVGTTLINLLNHSPTIQIPNAWEGAINFIKDLLIGLVNVAKSAGTLLINVLALPLKIAIKAAVDLASFAGNIIKGVFGLIFLPFQPVIITFKLISDIVFGVITGVLGLATFVAKEILTIGQGIFGLITSSVELIVKGTIAALFVPVKLVSVVFDGIGRGINLVIDLIGQAGTTVGRVLLLPIQAVAEVFKGIGRLIQEIINSAGNLGNSLIATADSLINALNPFKQEKPVEPKAPVSTSKPVVSNKPVQQQEQLQKKSFLEKLNPFRQKVEAPATVPTGETTEVSPSPSIAANNTGNADTAKNVVKIADSIALRIQDRFEYLNREGIGSIGTLITPDIQEIGNSFGTLLGDFVDFTKRAAISIATLNLPGLASAIGDFAGNFGFAAQGIIHGFGSMTMSALAFAATVVTSISPLVLVFGGLAFVAAVVLANFLGLRTILKGIIQVGIGVGMILAASFQGVIDIAGALLTIVQGVSRALRGDFTLLETGIDQFKNAWGLMTLRLESGFGMIGKGLGTIFKGIGQGLRQIIPNLDGLILKIQDILFQLRDGEKVGAMLASSLMSFVKLAASGIGAIAGKIKAFLATIPMSISNLVKQLNGAWKGTQGLSWKPVVQRLRKELIPLEIELQMMFPRVMQVLGSLGKALIAPFTYAGAFIKGFARQLGIELPAEVSKPFGKFTRLLKRHWKNFADFIRNTNSFEKLFLRIKRFNRYFLIMVHRWKRQWKNFKIDLAAKDFLVAPFRRLSNLSRAWNFRIHRMEQAWKKFATGNPGMPLLDGLFNNLRKANELFRRFVEFAQKRWEKLRDFLIQENFISKILSGIQSMSKAFGEFINAVRQGGNPFKLIFGANLNEFSEKFVRVTEKLEVAWNKFVNFLGTTTGFDNLSGNLIVWGKKFAMFLFRMDNGWRNFVDYLGKNDILAGFLKTLKALGRNWSTTIESLEQRWWDFTQQTSAKLPTFTWVALALLNLGDTFSNVVNFMERGWQGLRQFLSKTRLIPGGLPTLKAFYTVFSGIVKFLERRWTGFVVFLNQPDLFKNLFAALRDLGAKIPEIGKWIQNTFTSVSNFVKGFFGSTETETTQSLEKVKSTFDNFRDFVKEIFSDLPSAVNKATEWIKTKWQEFVPGIKEPLSKVLEFAKHIAKWLINTLNHEPTVKIPNAWERAATTIKGLMIGLLSTAIGVGKGLIRIFTGSFRFIGEFAKAFFGAISPSLGKLFSLVAAGARTFFRFMEVVALTAKNIKGGAIATQEITTNFKGLDGALRRLGEAIAPFAEAFKNFTQNIGQTTGETNKAANAGQLLGRIIGKTTQAILNLVLFVVPPLLRLGATFLKITIEVTAFALKVAWASRYIYNSLTRFVALSVELVHRLYRPVIYIGRAVKGMTQATLTFAIEIKEFLTSLATGVFKFVGAFTKLQIAILNVFTELLSIGGQKVAEFLTQIGVTEQWNKMVSSIQKGWGDLGTYLGTSNSQISKKTTETVEAIQRDWEALPQAIEDLTEKVKSTFLAAGTKIAEKWEETTTYIKTQWNNASNDISERYQSTVELVGQQWNYLVAAAKATGEQIYEYMESTWLGQQVLQSVDLIGNQWNYLVAAAKTAGEQIHEYLEQTWLGQQVTYAVDLVKHQWAGLTSQGKSTGEDIYKNFQESSTALKAKLEEAVTATVSQWDSLVTKATDVAEVIGVIFVSLINKALTTVTELIQSAWGKLIDFARGVFEGIVNIFFRPKAINTKGINESIEALGEKVSTIFQEKLTKVFNFIGTKVNQVFEPLAETRIGQLLEPVVLALKEVFEAVGQIGSAFAKLALDATGYIAKIMTQGTALVAMLATIPIGILDLVINFLSDPAPLGFIIFFVDTAKAVGDLIANIAKLAAEAVPALGKLAEAFIAPAKAVGAIWEKTGGAIGKQIGKLVRRSKDDGDDLQGNLSEHSPGPTYQIRKHWEHTAEFVEGKIGAIAATAAIQGAKIEDSLEPNIKNVAGTQVAPAMAPNHDRAFQSALVNASERQKTQLMGMVRQMEGFSVVEQKIRDKHQAGLLSDAAAEKAYMKLQERRAGVQERINSKIAGIHKQTRRRNAELGNDARSILTSLASAFSNFAPQLATPLYAINDVVDAISELSSLPEKLSKFKELIPTDLLGKEGFSRAWTSVVESGQKAFERIKEAAFSAGQKIGDYLARDDVQDRWKQITVGIGEQWSKLQDWAKDTGAKIKDYLLQSGIAERWKLISDSIAQQWGKLTEIAKNVGDRITAFLLQSGITEKWNNLTSFLGGQWSKMTQLITGANAALVQSETGVAVAAQVVAATKATVAGVSAAAAITEAGVVGSANGAIAQSELLVAGAAQASAIAQAESAGVASAASVAEAGVVTGANTTSAASFNLLTVAAGIAGNAIKFALSPIMPILLGIAVAGFLLYQAWRNNFLGIQDSIMGVVGAFQYFFGLLFNEGWQIFADLFNSIGSSVHDISKALGELGMAFIEPFVPLMKLFGIDGGGGGGLLQFAIRNLVASILLPVRVLATALAGIVKVISVIITLIIKAGTFIVNVVMSPVRLITNAIAFIANTIKNIFNTGSSILSGFTGWLLGGDKTESTVPQFQTGGLVPGSGPVPAVVHGGEFVVSNKGVAGNLPALDAMNRGLTVPPPSLPQLPSTAVLATASSNTSPSDAGDALANALSNMKIELNFGDIHLTGATGSEAAMEFLDEISPQLYRTMKKMLKELLETARG